MLRLDNVVEGVVRVVSRPEFRAIVSGLELPSNFSDFRHQGGHLQQLQLVICCPENVCLAVPLHALEPQPMGLVEQAVAKHVDGQIVGRRLRADAGSASQQRSSTKDETIPMTATYNVRRGARACGP